MITLRKVSENATSILLGWDAIPAARGYKFTADGKISHTWDGARTTVRVDKNADRVLVEAMGVLDSGTWPNEPAPSPFPPSWADFSDDFDGTPASRWRWVFASNGNAGFPNEGAQSVLGAVRLTSPVVGGNGQLSSFYDPSGQWGTNGTHQMGQIELKRVNQDQFIWDLEWHENLSNKIINGAPGNNGINSCALGLNPNRTTRIQISGGDVFNHQYTTINDTQALDGNFHLYEWDILWSPTNGFFRVWLDGRKLCDVSRPTLLRNGTVVDTTVIGGYCYTPPGSNGAQSIDFRNFAVGAV